MLEFNSKIIDPALNLNQITQLMWIASVIKLQCFLFVKSQIYINISYMYTMESSPIRTEFIDLSFIHGNTKFSTYNPSIQVSQPNVSTWSFSQPENSCLIEL